MKDREKLSYGLMILSIITALYFSINTSALIPNGYDLAIEGVVIS